MSLPLPNPLPPTGTSSTSAVRAANTRAVLAALRGAERPWTIVETSEATGLSRPTAEAILGDLAAREIAVAEEPLRAGGIGRPARTYRLAAERAVSIGIDAGPRGLHAVATDLVGGDLRRAASRDETFDDPRKAADGIVRLVRRLITGRQPERVVATVGLPAIVDNEGKAWRSVVVPRWIENDLVGTLRRALPEVRWLTDNDANLAAIAEYHAETVPGAKGLAIILVGDAYAWAK
ncbi:MAG: hypothetical protein LBD97_00670, partial [Bifidobacteriaceae bacterium]|nr:hypothetical protein [Bifidobacteriaceae bacterium]